MKVLAPTIFLLLFCACGSEAEVEASTVSLGFPEQLACDLMPEDLQAEFWQSGSADSQALTVDVAAGTTSGEVFVKTGTKRNLVIDWFVEREGIRIMLAQVIAELDLSNNDLRERAFDVTPEQIRVSECKDVTGDIARIGVDTISVNGVQMPVCDLDGSCEGAPNGACSNLGEICSGADPLRL